MSRHSVGFFYYKNYDFEFKQLDENKIDGRNEKFPMVILRLRFRLRHFWEIKCHNIKYGVQCGKIILHHNI